jgi:hypothetical protein
LGEHNHIPFPLLREGNWGRFLLGCPASKGRALRGIVRRLKIGYASKRIRSAGSYRLLLVTA